MDNGFKIPNMNEGLDLMPEQTTQDDRMLRILQNINNSSMNESIGSTWKELESSLLDDFGGDKSDPDFKEGLKVFQEAAKLLGVGIQNTLNVGEDDDTRLFNKIYYKIKKAKPSSTKRVGSQDAIQIYNINGVDVALINSAGYLYILYKSSNEGSLNESADQSVTCPICGATWTPDVDMEDGTAQVCPMCDHIINPASANPAGAAEDELTITESAEAYERARLEESLSDYMGCIDEGDEHGARTLLESVGASAICESTDDGVEVMLEKFVIKVDSTGKKSKVKIRTKKMKRTPAQKAALRKARKTANKGAAKKKRKKAMKARARMGLTESLRKSRTFNAVQKLVESAGFFLDAKSLERAINEAYDLNEAEVLSNDENVLSTLETVLNDQGIEVVDSGTEAIDGVIVAHTTVRDTDAEVYLGDIADEVAESLQGFDVDYDEPEEGPEDDLVDIDFYFVPVLANESCGAKRKNESEGEDCEDDDEDCEECDKPKGKMTEKKCNESIDMFESFAGGSENVRCKLHPAFIKAGQVIYDADEHTVFTALTESVDCGNGNFSLAIDVQNSTNPELIGLVPGTEVSLDSCSNYFLLKDNPLQ